MPAEGTLLQFIIVAVSFSILAKQQFTILINAEQFLKHIEFTFNCVF